MGLLNQAIGTAIISTLGINLGFIFTWPASTMILFASNATTLDRPMTEIEISLLNSLSSVGGLISTLTAGFMLDKLGRKNCSLLIALSLVIFWALLVICRQVEVVLVCIFLSGISSSVFLIASVYICEISQESVRGTMTAANMVSFGIGGLILFGSEGYLTYDMMLYLGLTMTTISTVALFCIKDSPTYLLQIGKEKEAAKAIAFYRHVSIDDKLVETEINNIKRTLDVEPDEATHEVEKLTPELTPHEKLSFWQYMKKSESSRRSFYVCIIIQTASVFQGLIVIQTYIQPLIVAAMPTYSFITCSIALAGVTVGSSFLAAFLTDTAGRRPLMIYGSLGSTLACAIIGTQIHFQWGPSWISLVALYSFSVMYNLGAGTVPNILQAEVFLPEVKSVLSMMVIEMTWVGYSVVLFVFNPIIDAWGWGVVFYIFGTLCFLTAVYSFYFLPETKGLTVEEIQPLFMKKKRRNHC